MAWTQSDLDTLEAAIKSGVRSVQYADRMVTYHSLEEMLNLRDAMKQAVTASAGGIRSTYATFASD